MANKQVLRSWVLEALIELGGSGSVLDVSEHVWRRHERDLAAAGDLFYTWQYDLRWAAQDLRNTGFLEKLNGDRSGIWRLAPNRTAASDPPPPTPKAAGAEWSDDEIVTVISAYERMLTAESQGVAYRKSDENRRVVEKTGRSKGAVEFKFCNISAVLDELGHAYIAGYKPRSNVQEELRVAVRQWVRRRAE